jgi:hypothetical protein
MDLNDFRNSTYLTQRDIEMLPPKDRFLTIDHVEAERIGEEKDLKLVTYFVTLDKGLVTNMTNGEVIAEIAGSTNTDAWRGVDVEIYVDPTVGFGGKRTGGIRLRPIPAKESEFIDEDDEDDEDFDD